MAWDGCLETWPVDVMRKTKAVEVVETGKTLYLIEKKIANK